MMQPKRFPLPLHFAAATILALVTACAGFAPPVATTDTGRAVAAANRGDHAQAAAQYDSLATASSGAQQIELQKSATREWLAAGRPADAVRAEIATERFAPTAVQRTQLRSQLLAQLRQARERGMKLEPAASHDPTVAGWLELGAMAPPRGGSLAAAAAVANWRARYPNHPATELLSQAFPGALSVTVASGRIALLLPLSGRAAAAASTVRDGFLSAYDQLPANGRPDLRIYDTSAVPAAQAVIQARNEGAAFIVGPLTREAVAAVAQLGPEPIPVLALNFLPGDGPGPGGLYQFALSPEDEARQVARRILADGHRRGIAFVPQGDWGNRVLAAFNSELTRGGGQLVAEASYDPAEHDYSPEIKTVLRINDSDARHQRLQSVLGTKLNYEPRRRADIQFIFAPAPSLNARLLAPQLRYYYAGDLPLYSTSDAYVPDNIDSNQDLNGLIYPDMPWMIGDDPDMQTLRASIEAAWTGKAAWNTRLFAFGYDACQLLLAMQGSPHNPAGVQVAGLTGQLNFDANRRIQRQLIWLTIRDGQPRVLPASP